MSLSDLSSAGALLCRVRAGSGPIVAVALHAGHAIRPGLEPHMALSEDERLREEDPHTARMAPEQLTLLEVVRSRFEVDLNRPRFRCVYQGPQDAWGLRVWRGELPDDQDRMSRAVYDAFYARLLDTFAQLRDEYGRFVVLDLHSYNHRRRGPEGAAAEGEPEVNLGTGRFDRERWAPVVEEFVDGMRRAGFEVGENVKFRGGHLAHWVDEQFGDHACTLAIEFKKTYMDEWTGAVDEHEVLRRREALSLCVDPIAAALRRVL